MGSFYYFIILGVPESSKQKQVGQGRLAVAELIKIYTCKSCMVSAIWAGGSC